MGRVWVSMINNKAKAIQLFDQTVLKKHYEDNVHCDNIVDRWNFFIEDLWQSELIEDALLTGWTNQPLYMATLPIHIDDKKTILSLFRSQSELCSGKALHETLSITLEHEFRLFKSKLWDLGVIDTKTYRKYRGWVHPLGAILKQPGILDISRRLCFLAGRPPRHNPNSPKVWQLDILRRKLGILKDE